MILVDDHQMVLSGLVNTLNKNDKIEVVASFSDPLQAIKEMDNIACDVLVSDVRMKQMNGLLFAKEIKKQFGDKIKIVLISGFYTEDYHKSALEIGVHAFLPKKKQLMSSFYL
ncbi:response regulator transcription factor [Terrilactibacillus sp. S3-3]|nr:response regulator transcription factor [Terrilactibacillus sp. S3-3]